MGIAAAHESLSEGADNDSTRRRFQEPERDRTQDAWHVRERSALLFAGTVRSDETSKDGPRDRSRERGRCLRRHRAPPDPAGDAVPQVDFTAGQLAHRALRVRIWAVKQRAETTV